MNFTPSVWPQVLTLGIAVCGLLVILGGVSRLLRFGVLVGIVWAAASPESLQENIHSLAVPAIVVFLIAARLLFRRPR